MTSCPGCGFLMGDDELLCSGCADDGGAGDGSGSRFDLDAPAASGSGGAAVATAMTSTAVLERPKPVAPAMPENVQYRSRRRGGARRVVVGLVLLALAGAGVVVGLDGRGPFAGPMIDAGLASPPAVRIPSTWVRVSSDEGGYRAALPQGAKPLGAGLVGHSTSVGSNAALTVFSTDFGLGPAMAEHRSARGLDELVDRVSATFGLGEELVRREVRAAEGWATDAVFVTGEGVTTRARFHLARDRLHVLTTSGPDAAMSQLDEVHPRLLSEFHLE